MLSVFPLLVGVSLFNVLVFLVYSSWLNLIFSGVLLLTLSRVAISEWSCSSENVGVVSQGFNSGVFLFIVSELFIFIGLLTGFLYESSNGSVDLGYVEDVWGIDFEGFALLSSCLLISSGVTLTLFHQTYPFNSLLSLNYLAVTILLGLIFLLVLYWEWNVSLFTWSFSGLNYFYLCTGLHASHVFIGIVLLLLSFGYCFAYSCSKAGMFWVEGVVWYWHFVDLVWLAVFVVCYWFSM